MHTRFSPALLIALTATALLGASCGGGAVAGLRIELHPDMSGTVSGSALLVPDAAGPLEGRTQGASWTERANLYCARGDFADIAKLRVADITFAATAGGERNSIRVTLPRGGEPGWVNAFTPMQEQRERVARTFDPGGEFRDATTQFTLELTLPGPVISSGVYPKGMRGLGDTVSGRRATLVVPVDKAARGGEALIWDVSWK